MRRHNSLGTLQDQRSPKLRQTASLTLAGYTYNVRTEAAPSAITFLTPTTKDIAPAVDEAIMLQL
jgi:hypothetical protein